MSRISRYQDSMNNFIKKKSCLSTLEGTIRLSFNTISEDFDNMIPIILLTVMNDRSKKHNVSLHGYFMGCGIELMMSYARITDNITYYSTKMDKFSLSRALMKVPFLSNICLSQNIKHVQTALTKDKAINIFHKTTKILNDKLYDVNDEHIITYTDKIKKTDLVKYHFKKIANPKEKLTTIKKAKRDDLMTYIDKKFGSICQIALMVGWMLGGGEEKCLSILERIGLALGQMVKLSYDFMHLERDIQYNDDGKTTNYVVNMGIQEGFELFFESKVKFLEGCMTLDVYTNTVKEVIDVLERRIEDIIGNSVADLKSQYTIANSNSNKSNKSSK